MSNIEHIFYSKILAKQNKQSNVIAISKSLRHVEADSFYDSSLWQDRLTTVLSIYAIITPPPPPYPHPQMIIIKLFLTCTSNRV